MKRSVDCWSIVTKISKDNSLWDYLEPAEIMELVQRITEAKEKIKNLEKYVHIDLNPALEKLQSWRDHLHLESLYHMKMNNFPYFL